MLRGGNIVYDVSSRMGGVSSGGLGLIVQLVKRLRVAERIDERVRVLKRHLPYRESDHVLNLIYNVMSGGVCLQDVKSRREDVSYLESVGARKIPAPSTEGDFLRRFKQEDVLAPSRSLQRKPSAGVAKPSSGDGQASHDRRGRHDGRDHGVLQGREGSHTTKDNGGMDPWW